MKKLVLGHRGYSEIAPENTELAFDAALLYDFDGVEMDLHMTKDKKIVIIHDETVDRTSNGSGHIRDMNLKELLKLNFSYKFNDKITPQKIMTYDQFLKKYGNKFKVINTEIKTDVYHYPNIEKMIWDIHKKVKPQAKIIYSSFNFESLEILRKLAPKSNLGYLFSTHSSFEKHKQNAKEVCQYINPYFKLLLKTKYLNEYLKLNLKINTWTIDTSKKGENGSKSKLEELRKIDLLESLISNSKI